MVAAQINGQWCRAIIEEVNHNCRDISLFFVDYGKREITMVNDVRLLTRERPSFPVQAVLCKFTNCELREMLEKDAIRKWIKMRVELEEPGGVGRLHGPEYTLHISM